MLRQLEKIQKMVNTLLGHCTEAGVDVAPKQSPDENRYEDLGVMILKVQDGDLPHRSLRELNRWLLNDASAFRYYVDFQQLSALLYMRFSPSRFETSSFCKTGARSSD